MAKRTARLLEGGKWGLIGGFMERDETIAQGAIREVYEETSWNITNMQLLRINDSSNRPNEDRQNIEFVYIADVTDKTGQPDDKSDAIEWFDLNTLPDEDQIAFDHADNIKLYKRYLAESLTLQLCNRFKVFLHGLGFSLTKHLS